jgi:hypothetical protein
VELIQETVRHGNRIFTAIFAIWGSKEIQIKRIGIVVML